MDSGRRHEEMIPVKLFISPCTCDSFLQKLLQHQEKLLAISTLRRRDRKDPGAVPMLKDLLRDSSKTIRRKAVSVSRRFLHRPEILERLFTVASSRSEIPEIRKKALTVIATSLEKCTSSSDSSVQSPHGIPVLTQWLLRIITSGHEPQLIRAKALEIAAGLVSDPVDHWILYFHNKSENSSRVSAIHAMGKTGSNQWKKYLQRYLESPNMEFRCAALEALATLDSRSENSIDVPEDNTNRATI